MGIKPQSVERFLRRPLDSYYWIKDLSEKDLDSALSELNPKPKFHTKPRLHQKACFYLGTKLPNFLFFAFMGTGKTFIALNIISYRITRGETKEWLVLVPNVANIDNWVQEAKKHAPHLRVSPIQGTREEKEGALLDVADVYVVNYDGITSLCSSKKPTSSGKNKLVMDKGIVARLAERFDGVIYDESQSAKNFQSLRFKVCNELSKAAKFRYALTGTPFGRDAQDLWAQFYLVDRGETLGFTITIFREAYFNKKQNYWGGFEYTLKKNMESKLHRALQHRSIRYSAEECKDLPPTTHIKTRTYFPVDNYKYYEQLIQEMRESKKASIIENVFIRMRQVTSGFVSVKGEDEKFVLDLPQNPKLDALLGLLDEIPEESKVLIFHEFIKTGDNISAALKKNKIKHSRLYGGTKDKAGAVNAFLNDSKCRAFVVNSASGGTGLNLAVAQYAIFFESPVSPIIRSQAEERCGPSRTSFDKVFYYDIVMANSIDEKIISFVKEGKDLLKLIIDGQEEVS